MIPLGIEGYSDFMFDMQKLDSGLAFQFSQMNVLGRNLSVTGPELTGLPFPPVLFGWNIVSGTFNLPGPVSPSRL